MSTRTFLASLGVIASLSLLTTTALATSPSRQRVRELLSGFEGGASHETWAALGAETLPVLIDVYNTTSEPPFVRIRAVSAVANFPSEATRTFLRTVATQQGQSELLIREAVSSMARAFGESAEQDLLPFLTHASTTVRVGAVRAIATLHTENATRALQARLSLERDAQVRDALTRATSR
ncbi:MAG: HEAT repeat domain-containing protein [Sandaracinaceae bacterium]|nr:HEAT repeat domain-containing protein [Sandaracinaceae bacterium]